jgi:hypothetical protein
MDKEENPRFVVTNLSSREDEGRSATPMVLPTGLRDSQRASLYRASWNAEGRSDLCEHTAEAVEDRGLREGEPTARCLSHGQRFS